MNPDKIGLREQKKAKQKLAIMQACIRALVQRDLKDIRVDDLCDELGISKVTFFNYFRSKEQVLEYFVHKWQFETSGAIQKDGLSGRDALYQIFDSVGDHPSGQRVMDAVILFFLKQDHYVPMQISDYEYFLFDPDAFIRGVRAENIGSLFERALGALIDDPKKKKRMVKHLITGFYGVPLRTRIAGEKDLRTAYGEFVAGLLANQSYQ